MALRSDQLHSHQFTLQRVVGALAMRDPDPVSSPTRRIGGAVFASVLVAALALAGAGVYGALRPGGDTSWRDGTSVVVEQETAARFVYRDGLLHPVVNYSSALLILQSAAPPKASVSRAALGGVPRGAPLGIPGAPDLLPAAADLVQDPWTLCSRQPAAASGVTAESVLLVGSSPPGTAARLGTRAVVASDPAGGLHLVWNNRRHAITSPSLVFAAFAWPRQSATPLAPAVLNAVPAGPDLGRLTVEHGDRPSVVDGFRVGQVFVVANQSGGRQFGVAQATGLADITQVQADLLIADGANGPGGKPKEMGQAQYASAPRTTSLVPTGDSVPPAVTPELVSPASPSGICATFVDATAAPEISVVASVPRATGEIRARSTPVGGVVLDWVLVPPGHGAVVESLAGPTSPNGALALVSDLGMRFPVPSREVLGFLGFPDASPQRLPAALVALLPSGNALDPAAAVLPAT